MVKGLSGLGEVDPGFIKIEPNKVVVDEAPAHKGTDMYSVKN